MRHQMLWSFVFLARLATGQSAFTPTDRFSFEGEVKQPLTIAIRDLDTFKARSLSDVDITNHLGEKKVTLTGLKGVSLKDILGRVQLNAESPKVLSEFYFVFVASDKYTIVFSWNEIFTSDRE